MKRLTWTLLVALALPATMLLLGCGSGTGGGGPQPPILSVSQSTATFNSAFAGSNPAPISVNVTNTGGRTLTFSASSDSTWLSVTPSSGTAPQTLQVSAALGALTSASYTGHIQITANGAQDSPATVTATSTWRDRLPRIRPLGPNGEPIRSIQVW
jgi:hypothetical protein